MQILRIGTDIVKIARVIRIMERHDNFIYRILSKDELEKYSQGYGYIARRWAGKEAFSKAVGTGFRENCSFKEISILNDDLGRPYIELTGTTRTYVNSRFPNYAVQVSLSDDDYAIAFCILIADPVD